MKKSNNWIAFDFGSSTSLKESSKPKKENKATARTEARTINLKTLNFNLNEKLKPKNIEHLAVHPKKIKEVQLWLERNAHSTSNTAPVLLLTGPTGSGKTATLNVLSNGMGLQLVEWINPVDQDIDSHFFQSQSSRFVEFFMQSKYSSLCGDNTRVVVVEDFPNFIIHNPSEFSGILEKCVSCGTPLIFICTEVSSGKLDLCRTLFPDELKERFNITTISFNPCSITLLKNALKRAQNLIETQKTQFCVPSVEVVDAIISSTMGDIRCAINQYHFAALKGLETNLDISTTSSHGTKRKRNTQTSIKSMLKDEKLGLFHGLGRVLNPKRIQVNDSWRIQCDFDALVEEFSIQPTMFNSFLQENYVNYFGDLSDIQKAATVLSQAQVFLDNWDERHDTMLYALWIAVLGLMVYNEHRISKWNQIKAPTKTRLRYNKTLNADYVDQVNSVYYNIIRKDNMFHTFQI